MTLVEVCFLLLSLFAGIVVLQFFLLLRVLRDCYNLWLYEQGEDGDDPEDPDEEDLPEDEDNDDDPDREVLTVVKFRAS